MGEFNDMLDFVAYPLDSPLLEHLNEYQVATVQRMLEMERGARITEIDDVAMIEKTTAGVLANRVGSGKTRCALALAMSSHTPFCIDRTALSELQSTDSVVRNMVGRTLKTTAKPGAYKVETFSIEEMTIRATRDTRTLIIVQEHLMPQWCGELDKLQIQYEKKTMGKVKEPYYVFGNVTLATPRFLRDLEDVYYGRVIYDETDAFHRHTNPSRVTRDFTWVLTATVEFIPQKYPYDHILRYRSEPHHGFRSKIWSVTLEASAAFIDAVAKFPPVRTITHTVMPTRLQRMETSTPTIMTMTAKQYMEVLYQKTQDQRQQLVIRSHDELRHDSKALRREIEEADKKIERMETQLSDIANSESSCPICMDEPPSNPFLTSCCDTAFCKNCILKCGTICPYCRHRDFTLTSMSRESEETMGVEPRKGQKRDDVLLSIIQPSKKYLLIGDSGDIQRLQGILFSNGITNEYMAVKRSQIEDHRNGKFQVLIFNCHQFGKGLDMTYCDEIIVYGDLDTASMTQICGRLCRLGREKEVIVHIFENEV